jgi:hypothetical protein
MNGVVSGDVESSTMKAGAPDVPVWVTESLAHGVVVPIPTLPLEFQIPEPGKYDVDDAISPAVNHIGVEVELTATL